MRMAVISGATFPARIPGSDPITRLVYLVRGMSHCVRAVGWCLQPRFDQLEVYPGKPGVAHGLNWAI